MNSWRVSVLVRNTPSIADVVTKEFCFSTPRIRMHRCSASSTTATPSGSISDHESMRDLRRQPLLHLQPPRVDLDHPRQLRDSDDFAIRQVRDVRLAHERQQVMLAQGIEIQILAQDHFLVVLFREQRAVDRFLRILVVAAGEKLVSLATRAGVRSRPSRSGSSPIYRRTTRTASSTSRPAAPFFSAPTLAREPFAWVRFIYRSPCAIG